MAPNVASLKDFMRLRIGLVSCLIGFFCICANAQTNAVYLEENFSKEVTQLSPNFKGHNWKDVRAGLVRLGMSKNEFESTLEYKNRIRSVLDKTLYGSVKANGLIAFVVPTEKEFDPDKKRLSVFLNTRYAYESKGGILIERTGTVLGQYVGQNAFGATTSVEKVKYEVAILYAPKINPAKTGERYIGLSSQEAREIAYRPLDLIYIGRINSPYLATRRDYSSPSITTPQEKTEDVTIIGFKFDEIWLVDRLTGKIISKKLRL